MGLLCWKCGASLRDVPRPLSRLSQCPDCFSDLYCCRMCRKFAPKYIAKCSDERADPPQNKQGANFCDWFSPDPDAFSGREQSAEQQSKDALAALFGGAPRDNQEAEQDTPPQDARSRTERALNEAKKIFGGD